MDVTEQRHFQRVPFATGSTVEFRGERHDAEVVDISLKGALLRLTGLTSIQRGDVCAVSISLSNSDIVIQFEAEAAHLRDQLLGVKLLKIDIDSMIHLRNIVELNTANPDQVRKELSFLHCED
ncbi:PilZ domain-containing protein [Geobacter benzoatilyticus]|uniref:PilZ domain-containing protein n=1 Tax=Geobacter benzoatilyticus TaxID=2815309 RepID=A0ABX7Q4R1_9BACT|nr:PilZ domain-containing protein [Geobacter benzoatilyticus]QSV45886.1 PilZ domain-containing protein [Geobacter benzoatilyticus]